MDFGFEFVVLEQVFSLDLRVAKIDVGYCP